MTQGAAPLKRYTTAANLLWFALMFALTTLAMSTLATLVAVYLTRLGGAYSASIAAVLASFLIATILGGRRYAELRDDLKQKRGLLALGYVVIAAAITLAMPALLIGIAIWSGSASSPESSHAVVGAAFNVVVTLVLTCPVNYAVAWFVLGHLAGPRETR